MEYINKKKKKWLQWSHRLNHWIVQWRHSIFYSILSAFRLNQLALQNAIIASTKFIESIKWNSIVSNHPCFSNSWNHFIVNQLKFSRMYRSIYQLCLSVSVYIQIYIYVYIFTCTHNAICRRNGKYSIIFILNKHCLLA